MRPTKVKKPNKTQYPKTRKKSLLKKAVLFFIISFAAVTVAALGAGFLIYNAQTLSPEKLVNSAKTIAVYSDSSQLIDDSAEFKTTAIQSVPVHTRWAFICTEDKNFYSHHGFSPGRIIKATFKNLTSGYTKEGASTISQQLIKNTHLTHEKTLQRKIREIALAYKLEQNYTKDQILEMYFNAIYFGNGIYGLETASNYYFGKSAEQLGLRESAALAGLIKNPARYDPITNLDNFCERSNLVLRLMHDQKRISDAEFESAKTQELVISAKTTSPEQTGGVSYKAAAAAEASQILGLPIADISRFGYKIYSYFDFGVQSEINDAVHAEDYQIKTAAGTEADKCVIAARPDGEIVGYYVSTPTMRSAKRNFASALKPLIVYAPAIELGVVTPATVITDEPFVAGDFNPHNHDGKYHGNVTVRQALEQSYNVPAAKVLDYTRLNRSVDIAANLGLNLTSEENASVALGNTKNGTTFSEILAGYCTLGSGGVKAKPTFIKRIADKNGKTVYSNEKTNTRVLGEDTAFLVTDMLRTGTKVGTARALGGLPFDIAAKTGTSERTNSGGSNTDALNCSLTSDYVLLVWAGNADMKPEHDLPKGTTGGGITSYIARDIQSAISKNAKNFEMPDSIGIETAGTHTAEYYAKRYKALHDAHTRDFLTAIIPTIDGRISGTGAPVIYFNTQAHQIYEVYKNDALQEIVKNHSGEYIYTDTNAVKGKTYAYHIVTYLKDTTGSGEIPAKQQSNSVKLYTSSEINKNAPNSNAKKAMHSKQWFF